MTAPRWISSGRSHPGAVRTLNEDAFVDRPDVGLWAVADGMGGHFAGDRASAAIAAQLRAVEPAATPRALLGTVERALGAAHDAIREMTPPGRVIGSTVVALIAHDRHFACLWAGDSRCYRLHAGQLATVTRDHSLVQQMVDQGALTPEEARDHPRANVITRAVGIDEEVELDRCFGIIEPQDRLLLCSDGLVHSVAEPRMAHLLAFGSPGEAAQALIAAAVAADADDNVTAVVIAVDPAIAEDRTAVRPILR